MLASEIKRYADENEIELIVVGHPVNMDGTKGESAQKCAELAKKLENKTGLPVVLRDERLTTVSAHKALNETNTRGRKRKEIIDAVSAVMILEEYLRFRKTQNQ